MRDEGPQKLGRLVRTAVGDVDGEQLDILAVAVGDADLNLRAVLDLTGDTLRDLGCLPLRSNQQLQPTIAPKL